MRNELLSFLNRAFTTNSSADPIAEIERHSEIDATLPLYTGPASSPTIFHVIVCQNNTTTALTYSPGGLQAVTSFENQHSVERIGDRYNGKLLFFGEDISSAKRMRVALQSVDETGEVRSEEGYDEEYASVESTGLTFDHYRMKQTRCNCPTHPSVEIPETDVGFHLKICSNCALATECVFRGDSYVPNDILTTEWIFDGNHQADFIDVGDSERCLVRPETATGEFTRLQAALYALGYEARIAQPQSSFAFYQPEMFDGVMSIVEDKIRGYLFWTSLESGRYPRPVLQQLYIRPREQGQGYASQLISDWYDTLCDAPEYYAFDPNEDGTAVLDSVGHLEGATKSPCTPMMTLETNEILSPEDRSLAERFHNLLMEA